MNISGLIRSLVGDLQAAEPKVLELKVGQVVKGLVLQLLNDQEAFINISGLVVRAKLETPLKQGDVTVLQVQPESNSSQILLKPLTSSDVQIADESMKDLLKSFTLKDVPANRQMVQLIQQEGVPLTKETVQTFAALQQAAPEGVSKEEWTQAAVLAFKRGLPLTTDTVSALRQSTSGPPAGTVLERLELQVASLLQEQPDHSAAAALTQLAAALKSLRASAAAAWTAPPPEPSAAASSGTAAPAAAPQLGGDAAKASAPGGTPAAASPGEAARPAASAEQEANASAGVKVPASGSLPEAAVPRAVGMAQPQRAEPSSAGEPPPPASQEAGSAAARPHAQAAAGAAAAAESAPPPVAPPEPNWIGRLLQSLGVEHEHQLAKMPELLRTSTDMLPSAGDAQSSGVSKPDTDTLKSMLLHLSTADDLPAPLKETVQQALQQITGQQLLLSSDRSSMFSNITMFIPFMDGSGQQSASVHIQSRKGQRGEVDANNCRLLFDLQMKTIGNTLVDVQVVNKIVSLQVHNDLPALAELVEGSREEIAASLLKAGYQFFSLKCLHYPQFVTDKEEGSTKNALIEGTKMDLKSLYEPKPYKGVDYRA